MIVQLNWIHKVFITVQVELLFVNYKATQEHKYNRETINVRKKGKGTQNIHSNIEK
jgi:hypothetical protein